jgi:hypothetical protein
MVKKQKNNTLFYILLGVLLGVILMSVMIKVRMEQLTTMYERRYYVTYETVFENQNRMKSGSIISITSRGKQPTFDIEEVLSYLHEYVDGNVSEMVLLSFVEMKPYEKWIINK